MVAVGLTATGFAATDWTAWRDARETELLKLPVTPVAVNAEPAALTLAQSAFVRRVAPSVLSALEQEPATAAFLQWLTARRAPLEDFCATIQPGEEAGTVLRLWAQLWNGDPTGRDKYYRLALACALVFDRPVKINPQLATGTVDMAERYAYYRRCAETGGLRVPLEELAPFELVWVVDAPVPTRELDWARHNVSYPRSKWGQAYADVAYRLDKALREANPYKEYTLAEIKRKGGICTDQAYYAAISAKANGIPAMILVGQGQRGGHAWFGFKAAREKWDMNAGRYSGDHFATGYTTDPQTGQRVKEQALLLMADYQRRQPEYLLATRLVWLADVCAAGGQRDRALAALETATQLCPRHLPAWTALFAQYRDGGAPAAKLAAQLEAVRSAFREYPDVLDLVAEWEVAMHRRAGNDTAAAESLRDQQRRLSSRGKTGERTDLLVETVLERAQLLADSGDLAAADNLYREALRQQNRNLPGFCALADRYFQFAEKHNRRADAVRVILDNFSRLPVTGDPFSQLAYARAERQMAGYLERDGQAGRARDLLARADRRERQARAAR